MQEWRMGDGMGVGTKTSFLSFFLSYFFLHKRVAGRVAAI